MPTHAEHRYLPYSQKELFELVAAVERYPEFLPWCVGARIKSRKDNELLADLVIGFKMIRERFTSLVKLDRPGLRIDVTYTEGPFRYLDSKWTFSPEGQGTRVRFDIDFKISNPMIAAVAEPAFASKQREIVDAFMDEAERRFG